MTFKDLRRRFFEQHLDLNPEEATALGASTHADVWTDLSEAGTAQAVGLCEDTLQQLSNIDVEGSAERVDLDSIRRFCEFRSRQLSDERYPGSRVEAGVYPYAVLHYQMSQAKTAADWDAIIRRTQAVDSVLRSHRHNLSAGRVSGHTPDRDVTRHLVENEIPDIVRFCESELANFPARLEGWSDDLRPSWENACQALESAYSTHLAFLKDELLEHCRETVRLGGDEYSWRLEAVYDSPHVVEDLFDEAEQHLSEIGAQLEEKCASWSSQNDVAATEVADIIGGIMKARIDPAVGVIDTYRGLIERATQVCRDEELFEIPEGFDLRIAPIPPGLRTGNATNWPAPPLNPERPGWFVVADVPEYHCAAWAADLAVHEGVPGHYLQSLAWQRMSWGNREPVTSIAVTDDVAMAYDYFGTMPNVEGYAVYAEELMRQKGYYSAEEEICVLVSHAIRAARVLIDVGYHIGRFDAQSAAETMRKGAFISENIARMEVGRVQRIPMQAMTYWLGWRMIERLRDDWLTGPRTLKDFHREFFSYGPAGLGAIRTEMLRESAAR